MRRYQNGTMYYTLTENAFAPERVYPDDAGADLRTPERVVIHPHDTVKIDTGVAMEFHEGSMGWVAPKSGLASKGITVDGGIIDASYRGTIKVLIRNETDAPYIFERGDKIAQLITLPVIICQMKNAESIDEGSTGRGANGFGSTGK